MADAGGEFTLKRLIIDVCSAHLEAENTASPSTYISELLECGSGQPIKSRDQSTFSSLFLREFTEVNEISQVLSNYAE